MAGARTIPRTRFVVCGHRERACISPQNEEAAPALDVVDGDGYIREERTTAECKKWKNQNDDYSITPVPYVYDGAHHTPLGLFSKSDCSTSKRVPKPTDTTAKRLQRRDFWHRHYSNCRDINHGKSAERGVMYTVVYATIGSTKLPGLKGG